MQEKESLDNDLYEVVYNDEQQYSIWPLGKDIPAGWNKAEQTGSRQKCLEYIASVWTDMTPFSLRNKKN